MGKLAIYLLICILALAIFLANKNPAFAESIFLPPHNGNLYQKDPAALNESEYWRIKIFGLRMAALDPSVWAIRRIDRTDNRRLVPMRPYFLRESESREFLLKEVALQFSFPQISSKEALRVPFRRDALLDIELGGEFEEGAPHSEAKVDRGYIVRFSAFPLMPSGFYLRDHAAATLIGEFPFKLIETGKDLEYSISLSENGITVHSGGGEIAGLKKDLRHGLVSLQTGWHPLTLNQLLITGESRDSKGKIVKVNFSGTVALPKSPPKRKRERQE